MQENKDNTTSAEKMRMSGMDTNKNKSHVKKKTSEIRRYREGPSE